MSKQTSALERIEQLIEMGVQVLSTHRPPPPNVISAFTLDEAAFTEWQTRTLNALEQFFGSSNVYTRNFKQNVEYNTSADVQRGLGILRGAKDEVTVLGPSATGAQDSLPHIERICERFHLVARQLRQRHDGRPTLDVTDEYDAQNLLHALLRLFFDDVRSEEWTPSYAGGASRMDFLLKQEKTVIEVKKTRKGLSDRDVGSQLLEDIARYKEHPACSTLVCLVYDPDGRVANPRGLENDLSRVHDGLRVRAIISPRGS